MSTLSSVLQRNSLTLGALIKFLQNPGSAFGEGHRQTISSSAASKRRPRGPPWLRAPLKVFYDKHAEQTHCTIVCVKRFLRRKDCAKELLWLLHSLDFAGLCLLQSLTKVSLFKIPGNVILSEKLIEWKKRRKKINVDGIVSGISNQSYSFVRLLSILLICNILFICLPAVFSTNTPLHILEYVTKP